MVVSGESGAVSGDVERDSDAQTESSGIWMRLSSMARMDRSLSENGVLHVLPGEGCAEEFVVQRGN